MCSNFQPDPFPSCVKATHDKPGSVFRTKEGKRKGTSQPGHGAAIGLIMFCCNHRGQPLVANGGYISQASCCRQSEGSEEIMLNLVYALFIDRVFVLSSRWRWSMGVKDSDVNGD